MHTKNQTTTNKKRQNVNKRKKIKYNKNQSKTRGLCYKSSVTKLASELNACIQINIFTLQQDGRMAHTSYATQN